MEDVETFEAADDRTADAEAYRRSRNLPHGWFAALCDAGGEQINAYEAPNAQGS
jgi:hypothetical protein